MTHEEICTYEVAKLAKENGFPQHIGNDAYIEENEYDDEYEVGCYYPIQFIPDYLPTITAPTQSLLQRWLREEKGVFIEIRSDVNEQLERITSRYNIVYDYDGRSSSVHICCDEYSTYELALEDALKYALENLV